MMKQIFIVVLSLLIVSCSSLKPNSNTEYQGSGFIVNSKGYIITAKHVIEKSNEYIVVYKNNYYKAILIDTSYNDIAVLKINLHTPDYLSFRTQFSVIYGAISGYPRANYNNQQRFTVPALIETGIRHAYIKVVTHPGQSGGPAIDNCGNVLAIYNYTFTLTYKTKNQVGGGPMSWLILKVLQSNNINYSVNQTCTKNSINFNKDAVVLIYGYS